MDLSKSYDFFQPEKFTDRIHIIGCGSVGSTIAELLARYGVTKFTLWDFDVVEPHNLANQMFRQKDIGQPKTEALLNILTEINPEIKDFAKLESNGWNGQQLNGFVFLAVDNIDLRRKIVERHIDSPFIRAVFDVRTRLTDAQHYAADWRDYKSKQALLGTMQFSHEEATEATPVSACNVTLGVASTVRVICAYAVNNFINFWNGKGVKKMILADVHEFTVDAI